MIDSRETLDPNSILYFKSFGAINQDKNFLVIQQGVSGRGLFSLLSSVLCWLDIAEKYGLIPVVDLENFLCEYNEEEEISGTSNAWEYFFEPVSSYSLDDVYSSSRVFVSNERYPSGYSYSITNEPVLADVYNKYIRPKQEIVSDASIERLSIGEEPLIGVHFRGQEFRRAFGHWFPPSNIQIAQSIEIMLRHFGGGRIFVCTEDQGYLDYIVQSFPGLVVYHDHYRTKGQNAYKQNPRKLHKYLLGREVMVDMLTLSQCDAFIGCTSNVAEMARFLGRQNHKMQIKINNGRNGWRKPFTGLLWGIKSRLPAMYGGFGLDEKTLILKSIK